MKRMQQYDRTSFYSAFGAILATDMRATESVLWASILDKLVTDGAVHLR